jgi:hypothetical protein
LRDRAGSAFKMNKLNTLLDAEAASIIPLAH